MSIVDLIQKTCSFFPKLTVFFLHVGMILVSAYHVYHENPFFNTMYADAKGFEKVGNFFLTPSHYLCEGKVVSADYKVQQRFRYETGKKFYAPLALSYAVPGVIFGTICKGIAFISPEVRERHTKIEKIIHPREVVLNHQTYQEMGLEINDWTQGEILISQGYLRPLGTEKTLKHDKKCLREIAHLLTEANIPFWVDCGTCIGTYRHGGVIPWDNDLDLSVLISDFQNVMNVLRKLDPKKYVAQDWSSRECPGSYIRVYVKKSRNHIDIYMNTIDPVAKTITYLVAHENSHFMATAWKERERLQKKPIPFEVIFPLKKGTFDGIDVPVPNQTTRFLTYKYGPNLSPPRLYNPETEQYEKDLTHPYWNVPLAH
jgi:hypothetical protein